jgi:hypothetical protein
MDCPGLYACVSAAHNIVLKMSIIWYLIVTHMSLYVIGIALCLTGVALGTPGWSVGSLMLGAGWLNLLIKLMYVDSRRSSMNDS